MDESVVEIGISPFKMKSNLPQKIDFQFANIFNWRTLLSVQDKDNLLEIKNIYKKKNCRNKESVIVAVST